MRGSSTLVRVKVKVRGRIRVRVRVRVRALLARVLHLGRRVLTAGREQPAEAMVAEERLEVVRECLQHGG